MLVAGIVMLFYIGKTKRRLEPTSRHSLDLAPNTNEMRTHICKHGGSLWPSKYLRHFAGFLFRQYHC